MWAEREARRPVVNARDKVDQLDSAADVFT